MRSQYHFKLFIICAISLLIATEVSDASKPYQSGELLSQQAVTYGKFDVVMKPASGDGIISSFFLFKTLRHPHDTWREIDIEVLGGRPTEITTNLITNQLNKTGNTLKHDANINLSSGFHTYSIEWTPDEISWYLNEQLIRQANIDIVKSFRDQPLTIRFNLWPTHLKNWAGHFSDHILPVTHRIQSITYSKYTPHEKFNGKPFKFSWSESFNRFNSSRWTKADWSFDENLSQFTHHNVYIRNGKLIIKLNKKTGG